ncbi:MAG: hypothetical protein KDI15_10280, partial [Thiothrix sp.]|nr:hypothetical protein [Thiothrix sp.]
MLKTLGLSASVLLMTANSAWAANEVLDYTIRWSTADNRYHVYMTPTETPSPDSSMTAQVTILVPSGTGSDYFTVSNLTSAVSGANWADNSRSDAPVENPTHDYISFALVYNSPASSFQWQAGQETEVFSFANTNSCLGPVSLIDSTDPFMPENSTQGSSAGSNSLGTNPGNQFTNMGWGDGSSNNYRQNYGTAADCADSLDPDGDGIITGDEKLIGTDPNNPDTDGDGVP